jgi:hypothetical protein
MVQFFIGECILILGEMLLGRVDIVLFPLIRCSMSYQELSDSPLLGSLFPRSKDDPEEKEKERMQRSQRWRCPSSDFPRFFFTHDKRT